LLNIQPSTGPFLFRLCVEISLVPPGGFCDEVPAIGHALLAVVFGRLPIGSAALRRMAFFTPSRTGEKLSFEKERRPMARILGFFSALLLVVFIAAPSSSAQAESGLRARPRITQGIDEMNRVALTGNTHPEARPANDRGRVANGFAMDHMLLQLKRSPEQELALQQFLDE